MEKSNQNYTYPLIISLVFALAVPSFVFCILAEFNKSKIENVRLDGKLCELPGNKAFGFGIAALICSSIAQIIGNLIIFVRCCPDSREKNSFCRTKWPTTATLLFAVSWISFAAWVMLISTASIMNRRQVFGKGWLDGECYLVKDGVFVTAAILVLLSLGCTLASGVTTLRNKFHVSVDDNSRNGSLTACIK
ncbi:protein MODIFYING WALL LIGNIN-1-like [Silene latifolia]|uniref:protein MODIFYING WALL LIGNIN-1-like n=1 Tax=Silene latifolia TaxID=37657 RepID=UPI003D77AC52